MGRGMGQLVGKGTFAYRDFSRGAGGGRHANPRLFPAALAILVLSSFVCDVRAQPSTGADTRLAIIEDSADAAIRRYAASWQRLYRLSENARDQADSRYRYRNAFVPRPWMAAVFCYQQGFDVRYDTVRSIAGRIGGADERAAVCPTWLINTVELGPDRGTIDSYLIPQLRAEARATRAALLDRLRVLDSVAAGRVERVHAFRVLMLVEQRDTVLARSVASGCVGGTAWCQDWQDYVLHRVGAGADRPLFQRARPTPPLSSLDSATSAHLVRLSPQERDAFEARLWWLADPLWIESGNQRRAEEFARRLEVGARQAQRFDERFDWRASVRGDAVATTLLRFGMPDYAWWWGEFWDRPRPRLLSSTRPALGPPKPSNGLQTSFEYLRDRVALVPPLASVLDPFSAPEWKIHADPAIADDPWWPHEHMRLSYPLRQLPAQVGLLRRHHQTLAVVGAQLPAAAGPPEPVDVHLVYSRAPDSIVVSAQRTAFPGSVVAMRGPIEADSVMIGLEHLAHAPSQRPAGRLRVGVVAPQPLSVLTGTDVAVSGPLLLIDDVGGRLPLTNEGDALDAVAPTATVVAGSPMTIYWESYGVSPEQAATHAVWLERTSDQGALRRLGIRLSIATDLNTPVAVQWDEERMGARAVAIVDGAVPVIGRTLTLETSGMQSGIYVLSVAIARPGGVPVRSSREIRVVAR